MSSSSHMDTNLVDKIVQEVKSQGVFDEFRKDCMADVDTKPAYQNLRQRVENAIKTFMSQQKWTPETNKIQLREKLRRHIAESGFLDAGVERIVDQVVNPKVTTVFRHRIEEIAYNYLGVKKPERFEPPPLPMIHQLPPLPLSSSDLNVQTSLLPTDLEQVSPESDRATVKSDCREDVPPLEKLDEDDESPPFEPLEKCELSNKNENIAEENHEFMLIKDIPINTDENRTNENIFNVQNIETETQDTAMSEITAEIDIEKDASRSFDALASQDSQLSKVSSDSYISGTTNDRSSITKIENQSMDHEAVNISEEAQMPKFSENSNEVNGNRCTSDLHFDIKKDEIKFEGTERKINLLADKENASEQVEIEEQIYVKSSQIRMTDEAITGRNTFQFSKLDVESNLSAAVQESSFGSSLDTDSAQKQITDYKSSIDQKLLNATTNSSDVSAQSKRESSTHSSSRHKKHSKGKYRTHDKVRRRSRDRYRGSDKTSDRSRELSSDKSRDRNKHKDGNKITDTHSSSKYSSSSSRYSTLAQKSSDSSGKHKSMSKLSISSSSSSSSKSESYDIKREKREEHKKHSAYKESSSSKKKRGSKILDDHNETKDKMHRRKSTDSNDEDENPFNGRMYKPTSSVAATSTPVTNSKSSSKSENSLNSKSYSTKAALNAATNEKPQLCNKVILLNDILQNTSTCVELESRSCNNYISSFDTSNSDQDVLYFESSGNEFESRIKLIESTALNVSQLYQNYSNFEHAEKRHVYLSDGTNENHEILEQKVSDDAELQLNETKATLVIDCIPVHYDHDSTQNIDYETEMDIPRKRLKLNRGQSCVFKTSPTPSDASANSKENEEFHKNADNTKTTKLNLRSISKNKLNQQQRYTSEDLYKPRPVLSQRSRRRGLNSIM